MIIASRLSDGRAAFLSASGEWVTSIEDGALAETDTETEQLLATAKEHEARHLVVDPYAIEVALEQGRRRPSAVREAIRAFGPTVEGGRAGLAGA
jgi:hypothetical protein